MSTITRLLQKTRDRTFMLLLLGGTILFVIVWYINYITTTGSITQDQLDWNIDQGYTMLMWGVALTFYCLFLLFYTQQTFFRQKQVTAMHKTLFASFLFIPILILVFMQWMSHDPNLNLYHITGGLLAEYDKMAHFLAAMFIIMLVGLSTKNKSFIIMAYMMFLLFELFEILVNYQMYISGTGLTKTVDTIMAEIGDVMPDIIFDTAGAITGYILIRKQVKR